MNKEDVLGAVARGWCHPTTEDRVMDPALVEAITNEVMKELDEIVLPENVLFERIWQATKHWDLDNGRSVDGCKGYAGMNGDDVRVIMDAIAEPIPEPI